jgi:hypothetical protein
MNAVVISKLVMIETSFLFIHIHACIFFELSYVTAFLFLHCIYKDYDVDIMTLVKW